MIARGTACVAALAAGLALSGCVGFIDGGASGPSGAPRPGRGPEPRPPSLCEAEGSPERLRRLSAIEVEATVRAVFGLDASAWSGVDLPPDPANGDGFTTDGDRLRVTDGFAERLLGTARGVAELVSAEPHRSRILGCSEGAACAQRYLDETGRRLYRRALTAEERGRYLDLHARIASEVGFAGWMRAATMAMLMSPHVVWRSELGEERDGAHRLTSVERATAIAYALTGAPPGDALLERAERGELADDATLEAAARELALDESGAPRPAFVAVASRFVGQWLGLSPLETLSKDTSVHPGWSEAVRASMRAETDAFVREAFLGRLGIAELLASGDTFADDTLAAYYGWAPVGSAAVTRVARPAGSGSGIFATGAFLSVYASSNASSPTRRGHFVRERVLCGHVPPPPATVDTIVPPSEFATTRQRYEELHATEPSCAGCHRMMDPIGFSLEHYDGAGRWRDEERGHPIDDSGRITATSRGDIELASVDDLGPELASLPEARACIAAFAAAYVHGVVHQDAECVGEHVAATTEDDLVTLLLSATLTPL